MAGDLLPEVVVGEIGSTRGVVPLHRLRRRNGVTFGQDDVLDEDLGVGRNAAEVDQEALGGDKRSEVLGLELGDHTLGDARTGDFEALGAVLTSVVHLDEDRGLFRSVDLAGEAVLLFCIENQVAGRFEPELGLPVTGRVDLVPEGIGGLLEGHLRTGLLGRPFGIVVPGDVHGRIDRLPEVVVSRIFGARGVVPVDLRLGILERIGNRYLVQILVAPGGNRKLLGKCRDVGTRDAVLEVGTILIHLTAHLDVVDRVGRRSAVTFGGNLDHRIVGITAEAVDKADEVIRTVAVEGLTGGRVAVQFESEIDITLAFAPKIGETAFTGSPGVEVDIIVVESDLEHTMGAVAQTLDAIPVGEFAVDLDLSFRFRLGEIGNLGEGSVLRHIDDGFLLGEVVEVIDTGLGDDDVATVRNGLGRRSDGKLSSLVGLVDTTVLRPVLVLAELDLVVLGETDVLQDERTVLFSADIVTMGTAGPVGLQQRTDDGPCGIALDGARIVVLGGNLHRTGRREFLHGGGDGRLTGSQRGHLAFRNGSDALVGGRPGSGRLFGRILRGVLHRKGALIPDEQIERRAAEGDSLQVNGRLFIFLVRTGHRGGQRQGCHRKDAQEFFHI